MHQTAMSSGAIPRADVTGYDRNAGALVEAPPTPPSELASEPALSAGRSNIDWASLAILAAFLIYLYRHIAVKLVADWWDLPDFSHGFLIPFFAAFLIWDKRHKLGSLPVSPS